MKTIILMRRVGEWLRADDAFSWEQFTKIPDDSVVAVTVRQARYPEHLVKYWAVLDRAVQFDPDYDYKEDLDTWIRLSIPWMRKEFVLVDGRVIVKLKSIALDEMDQTEFNKFYDRAIELITQRIGRDPEERDDARSDEKLCNSRPKTGTEAV